MALIEDHVLQQPDEVTTGMNGEECDEMMEMCKKMKKEGHNCLEKWY